VKLAAYTHGAGDIPGMRRLQGDLRAAFQYLKGPIRKLEKGF